MDNLETLKAKCILISPDGDLKTYPPKGKTFTLKELQAAVGGLIDFLYSPSGDYIFVVHDEALLVAEPQLNWFASAIFSTMHEAKASIFGSVLIVPEKLIN